MRNIYMTLLFSLMIPMLSFSRGTSQDTLLTAQELKKLNLILLQHAEWEKEFPVLNTQIDNYKKLCKSYETSDSLHIQKENLYYRELKKEKKKTKVYRGISAGLIVIICLILL